MAVSTASSEPLIGRRFSHYRILQHLGTGGMGQVYRATDEHLQREVAVKILNATALAEGQARERFRQEALALSKLNHGNIAVIYDFDTQDGIDFLVTELVTGPTLTGIVEGGPLSETDLLKLGAQLAEGLAVAHARGILHRDIKPANLRLTTDGRLKILDFGLAVRMPAVPDSTTADSLTAPPVFAGTIPYMSPEQLRCEPLDARSDIYSAGVVLYEMATGRVPFDKIPLPALIDAILHDAALAPSRLRPEISPRIGEIILKCIDKEPSRRYQRAEELGVDLRRASAVDSHVTNSVAVLYFENIGAAQENEYFRDGITEDITTELSRIAGLRVFSRSAVLAYRDKPVMPSEVGRQLNASHVVEGSLRRDGKRLRVTAKLVETRAGQCVWAERYDRQLEDVFAIQDEIAQSIARALRVMLTEQERRTIQSIPTADVRAYDFYLRGRHFFHQFRRKGLDLARQMFARAIELDPNYARAHAGTADCCSFLYMYWESVQANLEEADRASLRALELDPDLPEAHASRGLAASLSKRYAEAIAEFEIAIRLDPSLFEPYYFYGRTCYAQGLLLEAVDWFQRASRVCPEDYQSPMLMASALHGLGRREEALAAYRRGLAAAQNHLLLHPADGRALYFGANALSQVGDRERSLEWADRAQALEPDEPQVLYNVACVYALLGESDRALDALERSVTRGWFQREWMGHDPDLAPIREHPRFQALVRARRVEPTNENG